MAKVVLLGDTGDYSDIDDATAKWAIETGHVDQKEIMAVWVENNPLENNNANYAQVSNAISTCICGVVLI